MKGSGSQSRGFDRISSSSSNLAGRNHLDLSGCWAFNSSATGRHSTGAAVTQKGCCVWRGEAAPVEFLLVVALLKDQKPCSGKRGETNCKKLFMMRPKENC